MMSTITIENPKIIQKYSNQELKMKFLQFLESELSENTVNLYEIQIEDLPMTSQKRFQQREELNYTDY